MSSVERSNRNCVTSSRLELARSASSNIGGDRSARSRFRLRNECIRFCTYGDRMSNSSTRLFTSSRKRDQSRSRNGWLRDTLRTTSSVMRGRSTQPRQVKLLDLSLPAHVVHQEVGVAFAPNESHRTSPSVAEVFVVYVLSTTGSMVRCCRRRKVASNRLLLSRNERNRA